MVSCAKSPDTPATRPAGRRCAGSIAFTRCAHRTVRQVKAHPSHLTLPTPLHSRSHSPKFFARPTQNQVPDRARSTSPKHHHHEGFFLRCCWSRYRRQVGAGFCHHGTATNHHVQPGGLCFQSRWSGARVSRQRLPVPRGEPQPASRPGGAGHFHGPRQPRRLRYQPAPRAPPRHRDVVRHRGGHEVSLRRGKRWRGGCCQRPLPGRRDVLSPGSHPLPAKPRMRACHVPRRAQQRRPRRGDDHDSLLRAAERGHPGVAELRRPWPRGSAEGPARGTRCGSPAVPEDVRHDGRRRRRGQGQGQQQGQGRQAEEGRGRRGQEILQLHRLPQRLPARPVRRGSAVLRRQVRGRAVLRGVLLVPRLPQQLRSGPGRRLDRLRQPEVLHGAVLR